MAARGSNPVSRSVTKRGSLRYPTATGACCPISEHRHLRRVGLGRTTLLHQRALRVLPQTPTASRPSCRPSWATSGRVLSEHEKTVSTLRRRPEATVGALSKVRILVLD